MIQALRLVMLSAEFEPGFMGCQIYAEAGESESLCFQADWATQTDLEREIRSARFGRLLAVMEASAGSPTLEVRLIAETRGWKYVRELRGEVDAANGGNGHVN